MFLAVDNLVHICTSMFHACNRALFESKAELLVRLGCALLGRRGYGARAGSEEGQDGARHNRLPGAMFLASKMKVGLGAELRDTKIAC